MKGNARRLTCTKCNYIAGRDVLAVLNIEKRYLQMKGEAPFTPQSPMKSG